MECGNVKALKNTMKQDSKKTSKLTHWYKVAKVTLNHLYNNVKRSRVA